VLNINLRGASLPRNRRCRACSRSAGAHRQHRSVVGQSGNPGQVNYVASKAGIIGLTKALAQEVRQPKYHGEAVAPGFIETDMTAKLTPEQREAMLAKVP